MSRQSPYAFSFPTDDLRVHSPLPQIAPQDLLLGSLLLFFFLLATLGISSPAALVYHPAATLRGVIEMATFKLAALGDRFGMGAAISKMGVEWDDAFGLDKEPDEDELAAMTRTVRSYRDIKERTHANGSNTGDYYPGLLNAAGNLCFLNATLQSMASTPQLLVYLTRTTSLASTLNPPLPTPVASTLLATLTALNTPSTSYPAPLRPIELARALANSSTTRMQLLASSEQQDAHELWGMLREAVEEEVARLEKAMQTRQDGGLAEILGKGLSRRSREMRPRLVKDPFLHLLGQRVRCMVCGYTRDVRHTAEEQVVLGVPPIAGSTLPDLLQETFGKVDMISDYSCRKCSLLATREKLVAQRDRLALVPPPQPEAPLDALAQNTFAVPETPPALPTMTQSRKDRKKKVQKLLDRVTASIEMADFERELGDEIKVERVEGPAGKQVRVARAPEILTFHLNRSTHYGRGGAFKNTCQVAFPEILDLSPYCDMPSAPTSTTPDDEDDPPPRNLYRLCSLVVHYGTHSFGHYVAFRRRPRPIPIPPPSPDDEARPEWYRISDETVEPARLADVLRANPFLLFYEKLDTHAEEKASRGIVPRLVESWTLATAGKSVAEKPDAMEP